ncbi:MAG: TauD/TfdA family dioxygenase [Gammaproteobacteria bacterium]
MHHALDATEARPYRHFQVEPLSGALGAELAGIDLTTELPEAAIAEILQVLHQFKVVFFRDQTLDDARHLAFVRRFGIPQGPGAVPSVEGYPMLRHQQYDKHARMGSDVSFHSDDSFRDYPSKFSVLRALDVPEQGGDTIWVDMEKAWEALSPAMQWFMDGLTVEHTVGTDLGLTILRQAGGKAWDDMMRRNPPVIHPLVVTHPETGRKCIYASELLSSRIMELKKPESDNLLQFLFRHSYQPEFQCRFRWQKNSVAMWDNRCTQHRGIDDFYPAYRAMRRIPVVCDRRPARDPAAEPVRDFGNVDMVPTEALFLRKPELAYGGVDPGGKPAADNSGDAAEAALLADLNAREPGIRFSPAAATRVGRIPAMFRGNALSQIFSIAREQGKSVVDDELLDRVMAKRGG